MRSARFRGLLFAAVGLALATAGTGHAAEQARRFLDALREQGYYDTALDYIEQLRESPHCPEDLKESLDYEAAITLMSGSLASRDSKMRIGFLDQARDKFEAFLRLNPRHALAPNARMQLANVLVERGRFKMEQADKPGVSDEDKGKLQSDARKLFQEAQKVFVELERFFTQEHKKFPKVIDPKETKKLAEREEVRKNMLNARLLLATVAFEIAKTHPPDSKEFKEEMGAAAKQFNELYNRYKTWLAGLYARMWEGRCYKELGDKKSLETAEAIFKEILLQPDEPQAFRDMKNKSLILYMETLCLPKLKKHQEALKLAQEWEKSARPNEESSPDGLAIRFLAAEAARETLKGLKENDDGYREAFREARRNYEFVSRFDGKHQLEARNRLRELTGGKRLEARTFAEARDYGKAALDEMQAADVELRIKESQGPVDDKTREQYESRMRLAREEAVSYFHKALELAARGPTSEELVNDLNNIRYYLTYLYWTSGDLYEAAVLGEFLTRRYPDSAGARSAAKVAMAAWVKLRAGIAKSEDRSFETKKLTDLAEFIAGRWTGRPEAEEATVMLVRSAVADQDPQRAMQYLQRLPEKSMKRAEAEVLVGQSLWSAYIRAGLRPADERPKQEELDAMVSKAQKLLEEGIARLRQDAEDTGAIDYTLLSAVLSLAQIYVDAGAPKKALEKLEDEKIGPLTLVASKHSATDRGTFRTQTYKAALRAYVADQQMDKAEAAMNSLEELMSEGGDAEADAKLTQIYISLGLELEKQLKRLREQGKTELANAVQNGFELFLTRISNRPGNSFNSLHWVAETFYSLGAGLDPGTREPPAQARKYYEKARDTFEKILAGLADGSLEASSGAKYGLMIRQARCMRRLGEYDAAMDQLVEVIKENPMMVDVQIEAAYTYQEWATQEGKAGYYKYAVQGGRKARRKEDNQIVYLVWGWGKLARLVMRSASHRDVFHEARYNLALCYFEYAKTLGSEERKKYLQDAEKSIVVLQKLFPDLGGGEWFEKYDDLLVKVQRALNKTPTGLERPSDSSP